MVVHDTNSSHSFADNKRLIGRNFNDIYVRQLVTSPKIRFKIVEGENGKAEVALNHSNENWQKSPEEISSEVLKHLKYYASKYLGGEVTEAVISVPAHFSNAQRKATKKAAELAGLTVLKLITEPVAAAVHFTSDKFKEKDTATMLVFDLGGGTLDVSIIELKENKFTVKTVEGDSFLGGNDFDDILSHYFTSKIVTQFGEYVLRRPMLRRRIENMSRIIKETLSLNETVTIPMDCINGDEGFDFALTRHEMEELCQELFDRAWKLVEKCLTNTNMIPDDITDVVLVGGSSRIPKIQQMLHNNFPNSNLRVDFNPDEAVALGAAFQAASMTTKDFENYQVSDVTPLTLGIAQDMDLMLPLLAKNTVIPCKSKPYLFASTFPNQKYAVLEIYEGERKNCKYNNCLGTFQLDNLPPGMAGKAVCKVVFALNKDGILEVEATPIGGNSQKITVTLGDFRLCEQHIRQVANIEDYKKEDELFERFVNLVWQARTTCLNIISEDILLTIPVEADRELVSSECELFLKDLYAYKYTDLSLLETRYRVFKDTIQRFVDYQLW